MTIRMMITWVVVFILAITISLESKGFSLTSLDGLSQNDVNNIFQDSQGFMWFATNDGINKYDGVSLKTYNRSNSRISSGIIKKIIEDHEQHLWIATIDAGINRLDLHTDKIDFHFSNQNSDLSGEYIRDIICDNEGAIWYLSDAGVGTVSVKDGVKQVSHIRCNWSKIKKIYTKLFCDEYNRIWLISKNRISIIEEGRVREIYSKEDASYRLLLQSKHGVIVVAKGNTSLCNIDSLYHGNAKFEKFYGGTGKEVCIDNEDNCWILARSITKFTYNQQSKKFELDNSFNNLRKDISNERLLTFFIDRNGILFLGTVGNGVKVINSIDNKFQFIETSTQSKKGKVRSIIESSSGEILIGKDIGIINGFRFKQQSEPQTIKSHRKIETNNPCYCMKEIEWGDGKRTIIAGIESPKNAIIAIEGDQITLPKIIGQVFCIAQTKDQLIWFGSYNTGVYRFDPNGKLPLKNYVFRGKQNKLTSNIIRSLLVDSKERLWIGTAKGVNLIARKEQHKDKPRIVHFANDKLKQNYVLTIHEDSEENIWIGTMGGGLKQFKGFDKPKGERFAVFTNKDGLPNNVINNIQEDHEGNLWLGTNVGISKFNKENSTFENFNVHNGLHTKETTESASCSISDGRILFGGLSGVNIFYPSDIKKDSTEAIPVFSKFILLNRELKPNDKINKNVILKNHINYTKHLDIDYKHNSFSIQFASLHYSSPQVNKCRYILEGFDKMWRTEITGGFAKYTNLKPGDYKFRLQASNADGVWNKKEKSITITVKPPFFLSTYMKILYSVLIVIILIFFRKFSIINVTRKHELLVSELEKNQKEEVAQMKLRFFVNISHEFRTPLTLILNPLEQLLNANDLPNEAKIKSHLTIMHRNGNNLLKLINQLLDFRKSELGMLKLKVTEGDLNNFVEQIKTSFDPLAQQNEIDFSLISNPTSHRIYTDFDKLEKILNNIISNAFKYTKKQGRIYIELLDDSNEYLSIVIRDNGIGVPKEMQNEIFDRFSQVNDKKANTNQGTGIGLSYTKNLIELIQGTIKLSSQEGKGSVFIIRLPKDKNVFQSNEIETVRTDIKPNLTPIIPIEKNQFVHDNLKDLKQNTMLIVEDHEDLLQFMHNVFQSYFNVSLARNGQEAIEWCNNQQPDIIITDIAMPIMDGIEMTKHLKNSLDFSHIPIVMLTAQSSEELNKQGLETGADIYISKPFNMELLLSQCFSLLRNREAMRKKFKEKITVVPSELSPSDKDEKLLILILKIIETNMANNEFTVQQLAKECGLSQANLNNKLDALTGLKAKIFIRSIRMKRACQLLEQGDLSIAEITYEVGFTDLHYFRKCFAADFKCSPSEYRKREMEISLN